MKIRTNIQGSIIDIYPSGYDLTYAGTLLDFSNPNSQTTGFRSCHEFVEQLLNYNPGITHQLSSSVIFHQQIQEIQQQFAAGELVAVQPDEEPVYSQFLASSSPDTSNTSMATNHSHSVSEASTHSTKALTQRYKTESTESPELETESRDYQLIVEIAGRNLPKNQFLMLNKLVDEPSQTQFSINDTQHLHRSETCFQNISQSPRKLSLAVSMSSGAPALILPLSHDQLKPTKQGRSKPEWDNVIIPIKPLLSISTTNKLEKSEPNKTAELSKGWLYVFWKGKLWRELEVATNSAMRDCRVEWYRNQIRFNQHEYDAPRSAEGHALHELWVPYKIDNEYQLGRNGLRMAFSKTQWSWNLIEALESGVESLIAKTTSIDAIKQYSTQQHFNSASDSIDALEIALKASTNDQITTNGRPSKIAAIYLTPESNTVCLKINDHQLNALAGKRYQLVAGDNLLDGVLPVDGIINESLTHPATEGELRVWCNNGSESPSHRIPLKLEQLANIDTIAGIQARLNNLNHHAGNIDGIRGPNTLTAIKQFQQQHQLTVDGDAGPITQKKLKDIHGN